jgi:hypothetical protein
MKLWVNEDSTVLVRECTDGSLRVSTRPDSDAIWGPPVKVKLEKS